MKVRLLLGSILAAALIPGPAGVAAGNPEEKPPPPRDPLTHLQWNLQMTNVFEAWKVEEGAGTVIAIVDSGVDLGHPDLKGKIVHVRGGDFVDRRCKQNECVPGPQDEHGHGTHVAGIAAAATGNGRGISAVAPFSKILPVRVLDENNDGAVGSVARGIRYAADHGADVINLSLAFNTVLGVSYDFTGYLIPIDEAIEYAWKKGAVIVAAAGNDSLPVCAEPGAHYLILCVGATTGSLAPAYYTNYDALGQTRYLVAPGGDGTDPLSCFGAVISTYPKSFGTECMRRGYESLSGSSVATPHVSGAAALLVAQGYTNEDVVRCLVMTAADLGAPGYDPIYGYGLLDVGAAVKRCPKEEHH